MMKKKYKRGYTTGVFDMFHIGHLNILKKAKEYCDFLIVGVTTDELCNQVKHKNPVIPFEERKEIVKAIKYVDMVVPQVNMDKISTHAKLQYDVVFVGSDWKGTKAWNEYEKAFKELGVDVIYLPYTIGISSSKLREKIVKL
ncbi:MAG TPA: adenylyltransferase/cytidyltransferase family protein [Clostridia bacterium]